MDDIELAIGASPEMGKLYKAAKSFSRDTPILALTSLRGLGNVFCTILDRSLIGVLLDKKIKSLGDRGMLKAATRRSLRTLQHYGNIAAHPEDFAYEEHDFGAMTVEALDAARSLVEEVYHARQDNIPDYVIVELGSVALAEMCARAMLDRDEEAISQAGEFFKEKAAQSSKKDYLMRSDGYGISARADIEQAVFWFRQGASAGNPNCMYQYGLYTVDDSASDDLQRRQGQTQISRAAEAGHTEALVYVAQSSLEGSGIFVEDLEYARECFELAAEQGHPAALAQLGAIYAQGLGCDVDQDKAAIYTLQAAELGFPQGQFNLFTLYHDGAGVPKDMQKGVKWLVEAAAQDYPKAVYALACTLQAEIIPGRARIDAVPEYERAMRSQEFRARAALAAAEIIESTHNGVFDLVRAANHAQQCFEVISKDGDPHSLRADCLAVCSRTISRLREHINTSGPQASLNGSDVVTCTLFNHNCIPVVDAAARHSEIGRGIYDHGCESPEQGRAYLIREACLTPNPRRKSAAPIPRLVTTKPIAAGPKQKPNAPCLCGSGAKFKKCHGRGF
jgi:TPR repeat protein